MTDSRFFGPSNLVELVRRRAQTEPEFCTFRYLHDGETAEEVLTNAELDRRCRTIAAWLQQRDLEGERALLLYGPGLDFICAFFGCLYAGVVAVTAYPPRANRSLKRIEAIATDAGARVALTTQNVMDRIGTTVQLSRELSDLYWLPTDGLDEPALDDEWRNPDIDADTLAFLQYTSGSTGQPKGVMLSHGNLLHNSAIINWSFEHSRNTSGVFWLPSFHDMGLVGGIIEPLYIGCSNVLMSPLAFLQKPVRWLQAISRYRGTTSGGPNFAYDLCVRRVSPEDRDQLDLSSWNVAFNGAEPVRAETLAAFSEYFAPCGFRPEAFYPCFGLAESTLIVSGGRKSEIPSTRAVDASALTERRIVDVTDDDPRLQRLVSSGSVLPDMTVRIVEPESRRSLADGQVGEIWLRGPSVAQGYWRQPSRTREMFEAHTTQQEGPFLRTGDLGVLSEGELYITGRIKDLIIVRGRNHYPQDIEHTVERSHEALRPHCGAVFTIDEGAQSRLIVLHEVERHSRNTAGSCDDVMAAIRREVWQQHELTVDSIVLLRTGSISKTSSGKIQRHACRQGFVEGTLLAVARWSAASQGSNGSAPIAPSDPIKTRRNGVAMSTVETAVESSSPSQPSGNGHHPRPVTVTNKDTTARIGTPPARSTPQDVTSRMDAVLDVLRKIAGERAVGVSATSRLDDVGLDSLERVELLATLEDRFGGRFPEELATEIETVEQIALAVNEHLVCGPIGPAEPKAPHEVAEEDYRIERFPEYVKLREKLDMLAALNIGNPYHNVHESVLGATTIVGGREMVCFSSYNYLGLSGHPEVSRAAREAITQWGPSVSASRLVAGERPVHVDLEREIARLIGTEDAIALVGGHSTNEGVIGHLLTRDDLVLHDALAHDSILQGCRLSGARKRPFPHNDFQALDSILGNVRNQYRRAMILIEGVYSMDGDFADLPRFIEVKKRHQALLMIDEAHSIGVMGPTGRGLSEHFAVHPGDVDIWMGTLSKTLASCGGYIAAKRELIAYLKHTLPGYVFAAGLTPSNAAASLAAIRALVAEPERVERLRRNARLFLELAQRVGLNTGTAHGTAVVPVIVGDSVRALLLSKALWDRGIIVYPIVHPAVEEKAARLRFFITSEHTEEQIHMAIDAVSAELGARESVRQPEREAAAP